MRLAPDDGQATVVPEVTQGARRPVPGQRPADDHDPSHGSQVRRAERRSAGDRGAGQEVVLDAGLVWSRHQSTSLQPVWLVGSTWTVAWVMWWSSRRRSRAWSSTACVSEPGRTWRWTLMA